MSGAPQLRAGECRDPHPMLPRWTCPLGKGRYHRGGVIQRLRELWHHLHFERRHGRSSSLPVLRKLVAAAPQALSLLVFNFGSAFSRRRLSTAAGPPRPRDPEPVPLLRLESWPRGVDGRELGLPYSDRVVVAAVLEEFDWIEDIAFAMRELHRVLLPAGTLEIPLHGGSVDPLQRRVATPGLLQFFATPTDPVIAARSRRAGTFGLFRVLEAGHERVVLQAVNELSTAPAPRRIDIGCGPAKRPGYLGLDLFPLLGVDIVRDVDRHGLPFSGGTITHVYASHVLEHFRDLVHLMNEIGRVCCPGAEVELIVPTLLGPWAAGDPTHVRLFNARTFGYFTGEAEESYAGITARFELVEQEVSTSMRVKLRVR
jgi:ubiquinone/menaquinone biosynthesis C-methylase UbiE